MPNKKKNIEGFSKRMNICAGCQKACGGCSWSAADENGKLLFKPVPGWTAERVRLAVGYNKKRERIYTESYRITACPEFVPDVRKPTTKEGEQRWLNAVFRMASL